jgi:hypothetical protein
VRLVHKTESGKLELNWMWLPTCVGMNPAFVKDLDTRLRDLAVGRALTEELHDQMDATVIEAVCSYFPGVQGIDEYLNGLRHVKEA